MTSTKGGDASKQKNEYGAHSPLTYNAYLMVNELKQLQICQSDPAHHDEPLFITIHQTYELWFKLILHELDEVMRQMAAGKSRRATFFLRRVSTIMKVLVGQIHILETMSPQDFLGFRNSLKPASGFQSSQFREIEIISGLKDKRLLEHFNGDSVSYGELTRRYNEPSLLEGYYDLLRRNGFNMRVPDNQSDPESKGPPDGDEFQSERVKELRKLYELTEQYIDLHDLAEGLVDLDEQIALWRMHHVTVVERVIGFKRGTGGSEGVGYLRTTLNKRAFPDLWAVRTLIEDPQPGEGCPFDKPGPSGCPY